VTPPRRPVTAKGLARRKLGADGEAAVTDWYLARGYELVARNWRCREGEIDVIVRRGAIVVICEVKARSSDRFGTALEAVTAPKQRRLRRLAALWLAEQRPSSHIRLRFDVASVMAGELLVIENAF
jgi:putative endonuclease